MGGELVRVDVVTSTNDVARERAEAGADEGLAVIARAQTAGRGRRGRAWVSPPGSALYLSVILRPPWPADQAPWLGVLAGIATARAAESLLPKGAPVSIKWPNDVLVDGRKLAGVLVEPRSARGRIEFAVAGIGLNVAQQESDWPEELRLRAVSLRQLGAPATVEEAVRAVLDAMGGLYAAVREKGGDGLAGQWLRWCGSDVLPEV